LLPLGLSAFVMLAGGLSGSKAALAAPEFYPAENFVKALCLD
jgi:hypothetical protein